MAWTYDQLIAEMHTRHTLAQSQLANARTDYNTAQARWAAADDHGAIDALMDAVYHNNQAVEDALASSFYGYDGATNIIPTALDRNMACPFISDAVEYELTMAKIMDAVWLSTPLETFFFVNYVDAMRAAIWNKEISETRLVELYRHFSI